MTTFIYLLRDPRDNSIRYVGKADDTQYRLKRHLDNCNQNKSHKNSWLKNLKKSGLKPTIEIIEEVDYSIWQEREIYWIAYYKNKGFSLVNSTIGGEGLKGPSKEVSAKIIKSLLGRKHSEETKLKMSLSAMGNKNGLNSIRSSKTVIQKDIKTGKEIRIFNSLTAASLVVKVNVCSISAALAGRTKTSGGYKWEYSKKTNLKQLDNL